MSRYIVLYRAPLGAVERLAQATPQDAALSAQHWADWAQRLGGGLLDPGRPLGNAVKVTPSGAVATETDVTGMSILAADSMDGALAMVEGHHHLQWSEGSEILVLEELPIPEGDPAPGSAIAAASDPIAALGADRAALIETCRMLGPSDWAATSGCTGWTVKDLVSHLGALFWEVVDRSVLPDTEGLPTEQAQEVIVEQQRAMSAAGILEDYTAVSEQALTILAELSGADFELPLGDLGTYPASVIPLAFCFDHYVHLRFDLFPPRGPLTGCRPASDERRLGPALDWVETALPQQNRQIIAGLNGSVDVVVSGTAARTIRIGPPGPASATVCSDADAFLCWVTQRGTWEELGVRTSGNEALLQAIRCLKVF
jgi:uncharacterized protein (TIGR03083 family)